MSAEAADHLDEFVRRDKVGTDSRYLAAIADPAYERAFMRRITNPDGAAHETLPAEAEAAQRVAEVNAERTALAGGAGPTGGLAVPFSLDPSVQLTSDGQANPIRSLARVVTIATSGWKGVSSAGVTASWDPEATEVSDDPPTLARPVARAEKGAVFVPFSIEIGQDWTGLQQELGRLFADAKDGLEATAFISGGGTASNQPEGLHVGATAALLASLQPPASG